MLVIAVAGWSLGISPILDQTSAANAQVSTINATNASSFATLASLKSQFADIATQRAGLDALRESIPEDADTATFLQELGTLTARHNVTLVTVTVDAATVYQAPVAVVPPVANAGASSTPTPSSTPTTATTTPTTPATPAATSGFVLVPVSITVKGAFNNVRDFIGAVQGGSRLYFAATAGLNTDPTTGGVTGTLTGDIFTLQGTSDAVKAPAKAASTPAPTDTAKPTDTSTPTP
jgi:Tfp pilus assembly protein PilO